MSWGIQLDSNLPRIFARLVTLTLFHTANRDPFDDFSDLLPQYDFVVVGSGSGGSVVASRLAEVRDWNILVLESGGPAPPEAMIPAYNFMLMQGEADWNYFTVPQKHGLGAYVNRSCPFPMGRAVGGSSAINWMMYVRGNRRDYDNWDHALGNRGWSYRDVLPYFKKAEDYTGTRNKDTAEYHGRGGPLSVEDKRWWSPLLDGFLRAGQQMGYSIVDPNGPEQIGFSVADMTQKGGERASVSDGYLQRAKQRGNLHVVSRAHVTKILFDENKRATGVLFRYRGQERRVSAKREVVVAAGAVGSPKLLLLSGVGPKQHLKRHGIPVVANVPGVGENLQDHPSIFGLSWTTKPGSGTNLLNLANPVSIKEYLRNRRGPLTSPLALEGNAWSVNESGEDVKEWPDLQYLFMSGTPAIDKGFFIYRLIGFRREVFDEYFGPILGRQGFNVGPMLTRPKSRGTVRLQSADPLDPPLIDPNFLSHPDDVDTFVRGIKFVLALTNTSALRDDFNARFHDKVVPGCEGIRYGTDEYWGCYTRQMAQTTYHPCCTLKMGQPNDPMAVIDHRLRMRAVQGVRVVDASMMPVIVAGNLNAPVIMIGEKAADLIKEDWGVL